MKVQIPESEILMLLILLCMIRNTVHFFCFLCDEMLPRLCLRFVLLDRFAQDVGRLVDSIEKKQKR